MRFYRVSAALLFTAPALLQAQEYEATRPSWFVVLLQWFPIVFLVALWVFIIKKTRPQMKSQKEYMARALAHMDTVERHMAETSAHLKRLVDLAERQQPSGPADAQSRTPG